EPPGVVWSGRLCQRRGLVLATDYEVSLVTELMGRLVFTRSEGVCGMGNLFTRLFGNTTTTVKSSARRKPSVRSAVRLGVEDLEERCVPTTTYTWTGASSTAWENSGNWSGNPGHYPGDSGTSAISDIAVTASGTNGPPTISTANIKILQLDENTNYPNVPQVDVSNG